MLITYRLEGSEVTRLILPHDVALTDALTILGIEPISVNITLEGVNFIPLEEPISVAPSFTTK